MELLAELHVQAGSQVKLLSQTGLMLCSVIRQGHRRCPEVEWGDRPCSTVRKGCWLGCLDGKGLHCTLMLCVFGDCALQSGWVSVWVPWLSGAAGYALQLGWFTGWPHCLGQRHRLCSAVRHGHRLSSAAGWGCRLGSKAAPGHYSGSLIVWDQRLCSAIGQGCWLGSPPGQAVGYVCGQASWKDRIGGCAQQLGGATDLLPYLDGAKEWAP